jgi:asparagine synthetase B (glutamine-hydrolysing)
MAKCIYIYSKEKFSPSIEKVLAHICAKIAPDNIIPHSSKIVVKSNIAYGIVNPTNTILTTGNSLLLGKIFGDDTNWHLPLQDFPDGSFALFREGKQYLEIVSDPAASRTIWYFMNDDIFVASTSQRAIILFLGGFEFNEMVIPWMLSNGSLGPLLSWDKRINCLPPDSSVILNKKKWSINRKSNPIEFSESKKSDEQHERNLKEALNSTFKSLRINYSDWALTLSGGIDSRGVLCLLKDSKQDIEDLMSVTWGLNTSLNEEKNDAFVAQELAIKYNLSHKYLSTDLCEDPIEQVVNRFLLNGEGRTDQLSAYMDGFIIWKKLFEEGIQGIIRGDEGFGCKHYSSSRIARMNQDCALCSDFSNLKNYPQYGLPPQELPQNLMQNSGESRSVYRDRLFHQHALPTDFSALSDLKLSYVEVINPLLSRSILKQVRQLPDHLRTEKFLFKKIVMDMSPQINFATQRADASPSNILMENQFVNLLKNELGSIDAKSLFPDDFLDFILKGIRSESRVAAKKVDSSSLKTRINKLVPPFIKNFLREKYLLHSIDPNVLAFRVFLITRMNNILKNDCSKYEV